MNTKELIDRIFKEPGVKFELTEFESLGKPIHDIINIYPKAESRRRKKPYVTLATHTTGDQHIFDEIQSMAYAEFPFLT